jgi:hypothetical protein
LAKVKRLAWAQSETRREKHFLRKSAEPSSLLRNDMLKTRGGKTYEQPSSLRNEMLLTKGGETNEHPSSCLLMPEMLSTQGGGQTNR